MGWVLALFFLVVLGVTVVVGIGALDPHIRLTDAGTALIRNTNAFSGGPVRVLAVDGGWQSGMRLSNPYELVFPYTRAFDAIFCGKDEVSEVLCIGGGGFSYPRALAARGVSVDAVECDPRVVRIARQFFALDEARALSDPTGAPLLRVVVDDGLRFLRTSAALYDAIVVDAYDGMDADVSLQSADALAYAKAHLRFGGALVTNVATPRDDPRALISWATLCQSAFAFVAIISCTPSESYLSRNHVVIASDEVFDLGLLPFSVSVL